MSRGRAAMPQVAAWIDALREAFGREAIDGQIRKATTEGVPTFYATEGGYRVGVAATDGANAISAADMVIEKKKDE